MLARHGREAPAPLLADARRDVILNARARAERDRRSRRTTRGQHGHPLPGSSLPARGLLRRPAFTVVAALTLALGIGANTAIFSVVERGAHSAAAVSDQPIASSLIWGTQGTQGRTRASSTPDYVEWRAQNRSFEDMGVFRGQSVNLTGRRHARAPRRLVRRRRASCALIGATLERRTAVHRRRNGSRDKAPVAIISHEAWETRFGADPAHARQDARAERHAHTVVGVTRPNMQAPFGTPRRLHPDRLLSQRQRLSARQRAACSSLGTTQARRDHRSGAARPPGAREAAGRRVSDDQQGHRRRAAALKEQLVGSDARADLHRLRAPWWSCCSSPAPTSPTCSWRAARRATASCRFAPRSARAATRIAQQLLTESVAAVARRWRRPARARRARHEMAEHRARRARTSDRPAEIEVDGAALAFALGRLGRIGHPVRCRAGVEGVAHDVQDMLRTRTGAPGSAARGRATRSSSCSSRCRSRCCVRRTAHAIAHRAAARQAGLRSRTI